LTQLPAEGSPKDLLDTFRPDRTVAFPADRLPKVLVPILGHRNRAYRRAWIKKNRRLWDLAWAKDGEVKEVQPQA
jgi:hypothetical protein